MSRTNAAAKNQVAVTRVRVVVVVREAAESIQREREGRRLAFSLSLCVSGRESSLRRLLPKCAARRGNRAPRKEKRGSVSLSPLSVG